MTFSCLPACLTTFLAWVASALDCRIRQRFQALLLGALFADGRRTVTAWVRAAGLSADFRRAYATAGSSGRHVRCQGWGVFGQLRPLLGPGRLLAALDDTPTPRYGPHVEGAGVHRNPSPGPAGEKFVYGHVFVTLAVLATHPEWGTVALPVWSSLYVRAKDVPSIPTEYGWCFRTKLELAAEQLGWLKSAAGDRFASIWVAADGGYAKRTFLRAARRLGVVVVSRLRKDAALWSTPPARPAGRRGRPPVYGKARISLAKRAGQSRGWLRVECLQYGAAVTKTVKTFVATWRPAGGRIRVVIVKERRGWLAYFCTDENASAAEVLEAAADRGAIEQTFKDLKEVWGAGQQQVRCVWASVGCFNACGWMYSAVERWAWGQREAALVDRSGSPWDGEDRRPSHADKRKALRRAALREEIRARLGQAAGPQEMVDAVESLLQLAA